MTSRVTVRLPKTLLSRAKRKAAVERRTIASLVEDGLWIVVGARRKKGPCSRGPIPVSKATGGLMPGIDLSNSAMLQEIDDFAYLARMNREKRAQRRSAPCDSRCSA